MRVTAAPECRPGLIVVPIDYSPNVAIVGELEGGTLNFPAAGRYCFRYRESAEDWLVAARQDQSF
jgi:hypothetical protein